MAERFGHLGPFGSCYVPLNNLWCRVDVIVFPFTCTKHVVCGSALIISSKTPKDCSVSNLHILRPHFEAQRALPPDISKHLNERIRYSNILLVVQTRWVSQYGRAICKIFLIQNSNLILLIPPKKCKSTEHFMETCIFSFIVQPHTHTHTRARAVPLPNVPLQIPRRRTITKYNVLLGDPPLHVIVWSPFDANAPQQLLKLFYNFRGLNTPLNAPKS